jgi:hypothetical protein
MDEALEEEGVRFDTKKTELLLLDIIPHMFLFRKLPTVEHRSTSLQSTIYLYELRSLLFILNVDWSGWYFRS